MRHLRSIALSLLAGLALHAATAAPDTPPAPADTAPAAAPATALPLAQEQFVAALAHELASHFNLEGELQLDLLKPWTTPDRVATNWQVSIVEYPSIPSSAMLIRCRLLADGALVSDTSFVVRTSLWRDVWVTRQPIASNAAFDPAVLDTRRVDLFRDRDVVPATVGDHSFIFTRPIQAGRLLTWRDIARRPLVRKGALVEVSASDGLLLITMKGLAMQNGAQGEAVMVRNLESKKDFTAFVIDENRVQVRF